MGFMETFKELLIQQQKKHGLTNNEASAYYGCTREAYRFWKTGGYSPPVEKMKRIIELASNMPARDELPSRKAILDKRKGFIAKLEEFKDLHGYTLDSMADVLHVRRSTLNHWLKGDAMPYEKEYRRVVGIIALDRM